MIFTPAQQIIIRELCSLEFQSLERILINPHVGRIEDDDEFTIEEILAMHGCTRKDWDNSLIDTYKQFQMLHENPDKLFELGRFEMAIFTQVLHVLENNLGWKDKYPNAFINLWNKVFIWEASNEINQKN